VPPRTRSRCPPSGVKGHPPFAVPLGPRHLGAAEAAGDLYLDPLAPSFIEESTVFFMARRKATRRSSCIATFSAVSCPSVSGRRISMMLIDTSFGVSFWISFFRFSISAPFLPMTIPAGPWRSER